MIHRHIDVNSEDLRSKWSKAALFSLFERGEREDFKELISDLRLDSSGELEKKLMEVSIHVGAKNYAIGLIEISKK